jgi:hypothetical protein
MTVEYILLLSCFVLFVMKVIYTGPNDAFRNAGPKLGARVEKHLITGERFSSDGTRPATDWIEK